MIFVLVLAGAVCLLMVAVSLAAATSDIQLILAGIFALGAIAAFGFAAVLYHLHKIYISLEQLRAQNTRQTLEAHNASAGKPV